MVGWAGATLLCLLVVPTAAAELTVTVEGPPPGRILPEIGSAMVTLRIALDCQTSWLVQPAGEGVPVHVTFAAPKALRNIVVTGPGTVVVPACPTPAGSSNTTADYAVALSRLAPGLERIPVAVNVEGPQGRPGFYPDQVGNGSFEVEADYYGLIRAKIQDNVVQGTPGSTVTIPIEVTNFGNARTDVRLVVVSQSKGWVVTLPAPVALDPATQLGGHNMTVLTVAVDLPGGSSEEMAFRIGVNATASADATRAAPPVEIGLVARSDGGLLGVPGPAAPTLLVALAVLAARRRA